MQIFVEKNGHTMGPFTVLQLKELVASSVITKLLPAWVDGDDQMSTVGQLLASAEELATDRQRSSKLQAPPQVELHTRETIAAKFRPGRRMLFCAFRPRRRVGRRARHVVEIVEA